MTEGRVFEVSDNDRQPEAATPPLEGGMEQARTPIAAHPAARRAKAWLGWKHPRKGEQVESLCEPCLNVVREALRTLGIGCFATPAASSVYCIRCHKPLPWRYYLFAEEDAAHGSDA